MSAVLDDGNDLRVLPIIGKGGYQNVHGRAAPARHRPVHHAVQHHELPQEDGRVRPQHRCTARLHRQALQRGDARPRRAGHQEHPGSRPARRSTSATSAAARSSPPGSSSSCWASRLQEVNVDQADGYQKVKSGEIAATILIAGKPTGSFGKFKLEPGMTLLPVPYTEALEQDYFPAKLTNDDYPNLIPKGSSVDTIAVASVLAVLQLAARHGPLSPRRAVHRRLLLQVRGIPEAGAARQMEGGQPRLHAARLEALSRRRGMAGQESRQAGRRRPHPGRSGDRCARRPPRPRPTIPPSRNACSSSSWNGPRRRSAEPSGSREGPTARQICRCHIERTTVIGNR